jgi:hypothetical protein
MPTKMVGREAVRMTFLNSCCGVAPIVRADLISSGSTCLTAAIVLRNKGQAQL